MLSKISQTTERGKGKREGVEEEKEERENRQYDEVWYEILENTANP